MTPRNGLKRTGACAWRKTDRTGVGPWKRIKREEDTDQVHILLKGSNRYFRFCKWTTTICMVELSRYYSRKPGDRFSDFLSGFGGPWIENRIDQNLEELTSRGVGLYTDDGIRELPLFCGYFRRGLIPSRVVSDQEEQAVRKAGVRGFLSFGSLWSGSSLGKQSGRVYNENEDFIKGCNKNKEQEMTLIPGILWASMHFYLPLRRLL